MTQIQVHLCVIVVGHIHIFLNTKSESIMLKKAGLTINALEI